MRAVHSSRSTQWEEVRQLLSYLLFFLHIGLSNYYCSRQHLPVRFRKRNDVSRLPFFFSVHVSILFVYFVYFRTCGLSQEKLLAFKIKVTEDGICKGTKADGNSCDCPVASHHSELSGKLDQYLVKFAFANVSLSVGFGIF